MTFFLPSDFFCLTAGKIFGKTFSCHGVVAQLGERLNGIQEAKSSILFSSTIFQGRMQVRPFFSLTRLFPLF